MPSLRSSNTLSFSENNIYQLCDFLEQFKYLASAHSLIDGEKYQVVMWYVDAPTKELWMSLWGYKNKDYKEPKNQIFGQYLTSVKCVSKKHPILRLSNRVYYLIPSLEIFAYADTSIDPSYPTKHRTAVQSHQCPHQRWQHISYHSIKSTLQA